MHLGHDRHDSGILREDRGGVQYFALIMEVIREIRPCFEAVRRLQRDGATVALVPTMGALHAGHAALIQEAKRRCRYAAVSIFVNPAQFAPGEDYAKYPRTLDVDLARSDAAGADLVFAPDAAVMYPVEPFTTIRVKQLGEGLCGPFRPGHFDGVALVVAKLFHILPADVAILGEKDYQQLVVIQRLVADLNFPIEIVGHPTVREPDGLAMSSRNVYLTPAERVQARCLSASLFAAMERVKEGERDATRLCKEIRRSISAVGPAEVEYVVIVDAKSLDLMRSVDRPARICLAVRIGACRLIDNVGVETNG